MFHFRSLLLTGVLFAGPSLAGPLTEESFQRLAEEVFRPVIEANQIPGMAVGVTFQGEQYVFTTGLADRAREVPVTEDTLFELGSVSKLFNVALAAYAEEQGLLSLDDRVSTHLPELKGSSFDSITLYDLAAHANGGLPLQVPDEIKTDADLMRMLARWEPKVQPDQFRSYSNVSIGLLGQITGKIVNGSYQLALEETLLPQLGLENTFIKVPDMAETRYAFGYDRKRDQPVRVTPGLLDAEAYGVKSSVSDMLGFLEAHLGQRKVPDAVKAALSKTREARYDTAHYAQAMIWEEYAWPVDPAQIAAGNGRDMSSTMQPMSRRNGPLTGPMFLSKTGSTNGFGAYVAMVPHAEIGVVVLANRFYPNPERVEAALLLIDKIMAASE